MTVWLQPNTTVTRSLSGPDSFHDNALYTWGFLQLGLCATGLSLESADLLGSYVSLKP